MKVLLQPNAAFILVSRLKPEAEALWALHAIPAQNGRFLLLVTGNPNPDKEEENHRNHLGQWVNVMKEHFFVFSPAESSDLDVLLDDTIVEAAWKRRVYPKRILPHVVHSLRAERKLMVGLERLPDL